MPAQTEPTTGLQLLNFASGAVALGVSVHTFRAWAKTPGFPKPRRIGKRAYFLATELRAWLEQQPEAAL